MYNQNMNHKSFVFFDCECANTFDGVGKICSLGYVIADDELNVIESEDIVINPECEFDWYLLKGKGECKLAYSKDYFRIKPNFAAYYKDIKKLFTTGNRYILGFAVSNDVGFVNSACERYQENYFNIRAFDIEPLLTQLYGEHKKLSQWAEFFGVNVAKFMSHKSVDDAMMTMLCLKKLCEQQNKSVEQLLMEHKDLFVSSEQIFIQQQERAYRKEILEKISRLYGKKSPKPRYKTVLNQSFAFDPKFVKYDVDTAFELAKKIYDNGGVLYEFLKGKGSLVFADEKTAADKEAKLKQQNQTAVTFERLLEILK